MRPCRARGVQGSFDSAGASLREVPAALRMTNWKGLPGCSGYPYRLNFLPFQPALGGQASRPGLRRNLKKTLPYSRLSPLN